MSFLQKSASLTFSFFSLSSEERDTLDKLKLEVEEYLKADDYKEEFVRLLIVSFNETSSFGVDNSMTLLEYFMSFIRHRLIDCRPHEYKRLIHLLDAFIRNCGKRAQLLVGQKKLLRTIGETAQKYKKVHLPTSQACASIALGCLQNWSEAFLEFKDEFPYYQEIYFNLKLKDNVQFPPLPKDLIPITVAADALQMNIPSLSNQEDFDDFTCGGSSSGSEEESVDFEKHDELKYSSIFENTDLFYSDREFLRA